MKLQISLGLFKINVENRNCCEEVWGFDVFDCCNEFHSNLAHKDLKYCTWSNR